jgi:uncharacterized phage protein gp47/JayE
VTATVVLSGTASVQQVTADYTAALQEYYAEAFEEHTVRYTRIGRILSGIFGVLDYTALLLNGGAANIPLTTTEFPITEDVVFTT